MQSIGSDAMKSRVFTTIFDDPQAENAKAFARHLQELLELRSEDREACLDALPDLRLARTETQERELLDDLARSRSIERHKLVHAVSVVNFFVDALLSDRIPDDDWTHWADDLCKVGCLTTEKRSAFESLLSRLTDDLPTLRDQDRELSTAGGVLPTFKSFGYTVEVRPIRKEIFRWGRKVEEYRPEILGTIILASIHIGVDKGPLKDLYFQADKSDIDNMIATLMAAKKEMGVFREYLELPQEG